MILIVMGVSGAGKSTVGRLLAQALNWPFIEGDDHHPPENRAKMQRGIPLTDADRRPWLDALNQTLHALPRQEAVLACSALKTAYRRRLSRGLPAVRFIYLEGSFEEIQDRLARRTHAYWNNDLLASQFEALDPPTEALTLGIVHPPDVLVEMILDRLAIGPEGPARQ